jgi:hypothetical protein
MKYTPNILFITLLLLFNLQAIAQGAGGGGMPCQFDELDPEVQQSLTNLYNATNGNNWEHNNDWFSPEPVNDWFGICKWAADLTNVKSPISTYITIT